MHRDGFRLAYILGKQLRFIYEPVQEYAPPLQVHECLPRPILEALRARPSPDSSWGLSRPLKAAVRDDIEPASPTR
jgi:hypothetical protein